MRMRKFNQKGQQRFRDFVLSLEHDKTAPSPQDMLEDDEFTVVSEMNIIVGDVKFGNRLDAAEYFNKLFSDANPEEVLNDTELWSWLSLKYFNQIHPHTGSVKKLGTSPHRFIPAPLQDYKAYYRHLLRHPYQILQHCGGDLQSALCFLVQPIYAPGDFVEQLASRKTNVRNKDIMKTLTKLFVDSTSMKLKPSASSRAERMNAVIDQFDCTWDISYINSVKLINLLPQDFDIFRN